MPLDKSDLERLHRSFLSDPYTHRMVALTTERGEVVSRVASARIHFIKEIPQLYRGFKIGYFKDTRVIDGVLRWTFTAAWHWPEGVDDTMGWQEGNMILDGVEEIYDHARSCIDYLLVVYSMEKVLGRSLTIDELPRIDDHGNIKDKDAPQLPPT